MNVVCLPAIITNKYKPLYHISNYRTPIPPKFYDWRNLYNLPNDHEREYCWKCGYRTKRMDCEKCVSDKFFMTNK
jgi:hypothetical protein